MLPLIPAVLMIVLHGPAGLERMALDGKLGLTLKSLVALKPSQQALSLAEVDPGKAAGPSMAAPADRLHVSCFIQGGFTLLVLDGCPAESAPTTPQTPLARDVVVPLDSEGLPRDAYLTCRRVRDGPQGA